MEICRMQIEDVEEVSLLEERIFSMPWSRKGFCESLMLSNTVFLVAKENRRVVGYLGMYLSVDEAEVTNVAVAKEMRGRGVGTLLIEMAKKEARLAAVRRIALEVRISNVPAIRLYEKSGFKNCGVRRAFYELPKEDAFIMVYGQ